MITEAIINALSAVISAIGSLIPTLTLPAGVTTAVATFANYAPKYWELGYVLPVDVIAQCVLLLFASTGIALTLKVLRVLASFASAGGGSAG
jgi:hypothetical protein